MKCTIHGGNMIIEQEITLVMMALSGSSVVTTSELADKVEKILRQHMEEENNEEIYRTFKK